MLNTAWLPDNTAFPSVEAPSLNVTEPVAPFVTVAVNKIGSPYVDGLDEAETTVVVGVFKVTSIVAVAILLAFELPSLARYVKVSTPVKPVDGIYVKEPSEASDVRVPYTGPATREAVREEPVSFPRTPGAATLSCVSL